MYVIQCMKHYIINKALSKTPYAITAYQTRTHLLTNNRWVYMNLLLDRSCLTMLKSVEWLLCFVYIGLMYKISQHHLSIQWLLSECNQMVASWCLWTNAYWYLLVKLMKKVEEHQSFCFRSQCKRGTYAIQTEVL